MYYNFPQNRKYMINKNLVVKLDGVILETNGIDIDVEIYGVVRTVELKWLYGVSLYGIVMPKGYENNIFDIIFKPIDLKTIKLSNNIIPIFDKPVVVNKIYRLIAQYPQYAISEDSKLYSIINGKVYKPSKSDYLRHSIYDSNLKKIVHRAAHRTVATTWISNDDFLSKPIVNHKDGNKWNIALDNLEWVTYSENVKHAIRTGLATQQHKFRLLDTKTNAECIIHSARDLSKHIGVSTISYLSQIVLRYSQYVLLNRYIIKSIDNLDDWTDIKILIKNINTSVSNRTTIEAKSLSTGVVIEKSISDMAKLLNVGEDYICVLAKKYIQHNGYGYILRYKDETPWESLTIEDNTLAPKRIQLKSSTETHIFKSLREASRFLDCDKKNISLRLDTDKEYKSYTFKTC